MIYLINKPPMFCPNCSAKNEWVKNQTNLFDFYQHASMLCWSCGAHFCYIPSDDLISLARDIGSDLPMYVENEND